MAKGTPFGISDLEAKGFREVTPGVFAFVGKNQPVAKPAPKKRETPIGVIAIENILKAANIPYEKEFRFHSERRFRFDFAIPHLKVGIEYEGIFGGKSRHTSVVGYNEDTVKYNLAASNGWSVLRYTAKNYKNFLTDLKEKLNETNKG